MLLGRRTMAKLYPGNEGINGGNDCRPAEG